MLPSLAMADSPNGLLGDSVLIGNDGEGSRVDQDCSDGIIGKLRAINARAASPRFGVQSGAAPIPTGISPLSIPVCNVVGLGAKKQMCRIHARRVIAAVADQQTAWDFSEMKLPRKTMRGFPVETSISEAKYSGEPIPTGIKLGAINLGPKAFDLGGSTSQVSGSGLIETLPMHVAKPMGIASTLAAGDIASPSESFFRCKLVSSHSTSLGSLVRDRLRVHSPSGPV